MSWRSILEYDIVILYGPEPISILFCLCRRRYSISSWPWPIATAMATPSCKMSRHEPIGKVRLSPGTLYSSIRRMLEGGLVEELRESPDPESQDERRRYYRLTRFGRTRGAGRGKAPERPAEPGARNRPDSKEAVGDAAHRPLPNAAVVLSGAVPPRVWGGDGRRLRRAGARGATAWRMAGRDFDLAAHPVRPPSHCTAGALSRDTARLALRNPHPGFAAGLCGSGSPFTRTGDRGQYGDLQFDQQRSAERACRCAIHNRWSC